VDGVCGVGWLTGANSMSSYLGIQRVQWDIQPWGDGKCKLEIPSLSLS